VKTGCAGQVEQDVSAGLDCDGVEGLVAGELLPCRHAERVLGDRPPHPPDVAVRRPLRREARRRYLDEFAYFEQVFERDVLGLREKGEAPVQELGDVVDRREGDVATATGALRRPDQVLGGEDAERFPNSGPVDAKLSRQRCFVRQALPRSQLARDDEFAELVVHLLVGLPDAANRHVLARLRG
jgi:hypothetical protein